nr:heavy metal translocating P-type ATPase [Candidatus Chloroploca sp. Khr17]
MRLPIKASLGGFLTLPVGLADINPLRKRETLGAILAQPVTETPSTAMTPSEAASALREAFEASQSLLSRSPLRRRTTLIIVLTGQPAAPSDAFKPEALLPDTSAGRWIRRSATRLHAFKRKQLDPFFEDKRTQHLKTISLDAHVVSKEQLFARKQLKFHLALLASTTISWMVYPPLLALHLPFLFYLSIPMYKQAWKDFRTRGITTTVVDACLSIGAVGFTLTHLPVLIVGEIGGIIFSITQMIVVDSKDNTRQKITNLFGQQPKSVWVIQDGIELEVPFETMQAGDLVVVDAGQMIPVDGSIHSGAASIDQHMLTGEAQPAEKGAGDPVFAATVVLAGRVVIQVEKTGSATAAAQVGQILTDTSNFTASVQLRGKEIADRSAAPTLLLSAVALPFVGLNQTLAILLSGMGRTMRTLGPLSVMNFLQLTARQGILIKDGRALEQVGSVTTVVFDKTGTLTQELPHVGRVLTFYDYDEQQIVTYAAAAEQRQSHPIARAILEAAAARELAVPAISDAAYEVGYGITVSLDGRRVRVGSLRFMEMEGLAFPAGTEELQQQVHAEGHSLVYIAVDERLAGAIELIPTVRPEARRIVDYFRQAGLETVIISGDHTRPTAALAAALGIDRYFAETLPENKAELITQLQQAGKTVCFVGDGINDSIALKKANVSISLRGASTIATDTAQIILMDQSLNQLEALFELSKEFEASMRGNLISSVVPGAVIILGAFTGIVGYGTSILLFTTGFAAGVANAALPLLLTQEPDRTRQDS